MPASTTDRITRASNGSRPLPTTLTQLKAVGATSISVGALTGWATETAVHFIIYRIDTAGKKIAGSQTDWKGIASGTTIANLTLIAGTDNGYPVGAVVQAAPTAGWADDLATGLLSTLNPDGTLKPIAADKLAGGIPGTKLATGIDGDLLAEGTVPQNRLETLGWSTYTPALYFGSTLYTLGDGTITGRYTKLGRSVSLQIAHKVGSTTTYPAGLMSITLPVAPYIGAIQVGVTHALDSGTTRYIGTCLVKPTQVGGAWVATLHGYNPSADWSNTVPMTWAPGDELYVAMTYESAS